MERETIRIRALQDVTVVLPAGAEVDVIAEHGENIIKLGYAEPVTDEETGPSENRRLSGPDEAPSARGRGRPRKTD
jgi:hypothetical protein